MDQAAVADTRAYFLQRLHERSRAALRLRWSKPKRVRRLVCMQIDPGDTHVIDGSDESFVVRCASGSIWITHDGDPKDVILGAQQVYQSEREDTMRMHALAPCVVEIEFEDELVE